MRGVKDALQNASVVTVILNFGEHTATFGGVLVGSVLLLHVNESLWQHWISERKAEVITILQESFPQLLSLRIYADTHK